DHRTGVTFRRTERLRPRDVDRAVEPERGGGPRTVSWLPHDGERLARGRLAVGRRGCGNAVRAPVIGECKLVCSQANCLRRGTQQAAGGGPHTPTGAFELVPEFRGDQEGILTPLGNSPDLVFVVFALRPIEQDNLDTSDSVEVGGDRVAHGPAF